jgi:hypothetical protein
MRTVIPRPALNALLEPFLGKLNAIIRDDKRSPVLFVTKRRVEFHLLTLRTPGEGVFFHF